MPRPKMIPLDMSDTAQSDHDDYDDFDDGLQDDAYMEHVPHDLSPEDKLRLAECANEVLTRLGPDADGYPIEDILDALWNFYYDIDETLGYLYSLRKPPKSVKPTKTQDALPASSGKNKSGPKTSPDSERGACPSMADFFADMPWQNIPEHRRTVFVGPPRQRGGGLLGGAPKVSKLQALAAARKKKADENKAPEVTLVTGLVKKGKEEDEKDDSPSRVAPITQATAPTTQETLGDTIQDHPKAICSLDGASDTGPKPSMAQPSVFAQALLFKSALETESHPAFQRTYSMPGMQYTTPESLRQAFEQPSPDDVVLAAQSQAGKKNKKPGNNGSATTPTASTVTKKMEQFKVAETPLPKSKHLNVLKEYAKSESKKNLSFVVCGHVDSGKSTLLGRFMVDMGIVDQRTVDKHRKEAAKIGKESFSLAWLFDTRRDERENGVTIDINTKHFATTTTDFTLIDSPGHADFIPNMLAGASLADCAVLVVDASKGAFEAGLKGQMREHALLLRSMGVFRIIVAVNKLETCNWDQGRFDEIRFQVQGALNALRFHTKDVCFIPISGMKGANVVARSLDPAAQWYTDATLIEELERSEPLATDEHRKKPLRMTITGVRDDPLSPICVEGRIEAGSLQVGDPVLVQPGSAKAYIKGIEMRNQAVDWAVAGQFVVLHLSHISEEYIDSGNVICSVSNPIPCVDHFTMIALAFEPLIPDMGELHRGRLKAAARISKLEATLNIRDGSVIKKKPQLVKAGQTARIQVTIQEIEGKVPLEKGQRVVFRASGQTLAAGLIE